MLRSGAVGVAEPSRFPESNDEGTQRKGARARTRKEIGVVWLLPFFAALRLRGFAFNSCILEPQR